MSIETLAKWVSESGRIVFFGGAGVSTESGIKDYRSQDGLYTTVKEYGISPEVIYLIPFSLKSRMCFMIFTVGSLFRTLLPTMPTKRWQSWKKQGSFLPLSRRISTVFTKRQEVRP